jgi:hypothetical protein
MATWTRTEDENYVTFARADGLAGWRVAKHGHCHAEQWMPWAEAPDNYPTRDVAGMALWFQRLLVSQGNTVTGAVADASWQATQSQSAQQFTGAPE